MTELLTVTSWLKSYSAYYVKLVWSNFLSLRVWSLNLKFITSKISKFFTFSKTLLFKTRKLPNLASSWRDQTSFYSPFLHFKRENEFHKDEKRQLRRNWTHPVSSLKGRGPEKPGKFVMTDCGAAMPDTTNKRSTRNHILLKHLHELRRASSHGGKGNSAAIFSYQL